MDFQPFVKIPRLSRECIITEKIDGTNGVIYIDPETRVILAGSRNRWITPENDNAGFAKWVRENEDDLQILGPGFHYGEWWGQGIQRSYNLKEKRFSLFNVSRWSDSEIRPACCFVVPTLYTGIFKQFAWECALGALIDSGSFASPGFMRPEGIVIFHVASGHLFKKTIDGDEKPKGSKE
jgi:hypothetical protein